MPEIQRKQLRDALLTPKALPVSSLLQGTPSRRSGHNLMGICAVCGLAAVLLGGCGNKGDLYLPSDIVAADELEDAAEKLKKRKTTDSE